MITKEDFFKVINNYNCFCLGITRISKAFNGEFHSSDLFECDWVDAVSMMLETFIYSHFTEKGADWVFYYLYETIEDKKVIIKQEKDMFNEEKEIEYHLNSLEELWNFLLTDIKTYFKNAE